MTPLPLLKPQMPRPLPNHFNIPSNHAISNTSMMEDLHKSMSKNNILSEVSKVMRNQMKELKR